MNMDTAALRWFQQVADGVTVTDVSAVEHVTQSGVSRALARLEEEVGFPLLRRSGRVLRMTRAGATFKRYVDAMLHELDDGLAALAELASPDAGTVTVAFQPSLGTWLVPRLVAAFTRVHPHVQFELLQVRDELSAPPLAGGEADLEITAVRPTGRDVRFQPLLAEKLRLAVPQDSALGTGRTSAGLADASAERFVVLRRTYVLRRLTEQLCRDAGFAPDIAFEGDDLSTVEGFVAAGLGVALVPTGPSLVEHATPGVRYLDLEPRPATRDVGIVWSTERRLLPAAESFRRHVLEHARAL